MPSGIYKRKIREILVPVGPSIAYVPLTKGYFSLISREDVSFLSGRNWCVTIQDSGKKAMTRIDGQNIYMHRFLMEEPAEFFVDHANGNTLDNRRNNLRWATPTENCRNRATKRPFKCVSYVPRLNKWKAYIKVDGKAKHLGYYSSPEFAHQAYFEEAKKLFGEFARIA